MVISKEDMQEKWNEVDEDINRSTCSECSETNNCPYAWDLYNRNGDCLASK